MTVKNFVTILLLLLAANAWADEVIFEDNFEDKTIGADLTTLGYGFTYNTDGNPTASLSVVELDGSKVARMTSNHSNYAAMEFSRLVDIVPGKTYTFSISTRGQWKRYLQIQKEDGSQIAKGNELGPLSETEKNEWKPMDLTFIAPSGVNKVKIVVYENWTGTIYFDNITVTQMGGDDGYTDDQIRYTRISSDSKIKWSQFGPGNAGFTNFLRYHSTIPGICATSPDMGNTYQTDDNGASWYTMKDYDDVGHKFKRLNDLYYSTNSAAFGLAIECSHLWATTDTGKTWSIKLNCPWYDKDSDGEDKYAWYQKISALAIDPNSDDVWYVGAGNHPRGQSYLGWHTYSEVSAAQPHGKEASNKQGEIYKTSDGGKTWTTLTSGLNPKAQFCRIIIHPEKSNIIYAASNFGLFRSTDMGAMWTDIGKDNLPNNIIMDMDFYYNKETHKFILYVADQTQYQDAGNTVTNSGGIFKSEDNGDTWTDISSNLKMDISQLTGGVQNNFYKYLARWFGISEAQAKSKYSVLPKDALQFFHGLNTDPSDLNTLYVGFYDAQVQTSFLPGRLWQTTNQGESWISVARDFAPAWENDSDFWTARNNPISDNMEEGHYLTPQQWGNDYPLRSARYFAVAPNGDIMLLYAHNTFLSTDKGETWEQVDETYTPNGNLTGTGNSNLPGATIFQDKRLGAGVTYFGSGEHKLWRTTNDGVDGKQAVKFLKNSQETVFALSTHPWDEKTVYTTSMRQHQMEKIMKSTNNGESWTVWGDATDGVDYMRTNSMLIDPLNPDNMYFCVNLRTGRDAEKEGGVFVSTNGGKTFARRNSGLPQYAKTVDIEFDPSDNDYSTLYAAVQYNKDNGNIAGGLYRTNDRGLNWTKVNINSVVNGVNSITFDHTGRIYVTTGRNYWETEVSFKEGGVWYSDDKGASWERIFQINHAFQFDVSPFDHNLLVCVSTQGSKNTGIFISENRGITWSKNNDTNGQPNQITDVQFDLHDPQRIHMTVLGSGFFKGNYKNGSKAKKITVSPGKATIDQLGTLQLEVEAPEFAGELVYKSENPTIATVSETGMVEGKQRGAVKIWVTSADERYADFVYVVVSNNKVKFIEVSPNDTTLFMQDTIVLDVHLKPGINENTLVYSSSDSIVAKVENGVVTAGLIGKAEITVSTSDGKYFDKIGIQVEDEEGRLLIAWPDTLLMNVGDTMQLITAGDERIEDDEIGFLSRKKSVASVTSTGLVTAENIGNAEIMVYWIPSATVRFNVYVEVVDQTSIQNLSLNRIHIEPNPVKKGEPFYIKADAATEFKIYDVGGTLKGSQSFNKSNQLTIDTKALPQGLYLIYVKEARGWRCDKLIVN